VFGKTILRRIIGPKKDEQTENGEKRKLRSFAISTLLQIL
jgi:hypothetical protein